MFKTFFLEDDVVFPQRDRSPAGSFHNPFPHPGHTHAWMRILSARIWRGVRWECERSCSSMRCRMDRVFCTSCEDRSRKWNFWKADSGASPVKGAPSGMCVTEMPIEERAHHDSAMRRCPIRKIVSGYVHARASSLERAVSRGGRRGHESSRSSHCGPRPIYRPPYRTGRENALPLQWKLPEYGYRRSKSLV